MSGFSSAIAGLSSGIGQGMINYSKGKDDQLQYETLLQKKRQAEIANSQQESINDQTIQLQNMKLEMLKDNLLKSKVTFAKNKVADTMSKFADTYSKYVGKMASIDDTGTKTYNVPKELEEDIQDLNRYVVHNAEGADWINHFLDDKYGTMQNPIVNTKYEPETDQMVLVQRDGKEIKMSPLMMNQALGLDKYQSIKTQKQMEYIAKQSELKYKLNKELMEKRKADTELLKQENSKKKLEVDLKVAEAKLNQAKMTNSTKAVDMALTETHKIAKKLLDNPNVTKEDVKPVVDNLMSTKKFTDNLTKNKLYNKVEDLKYFADKTGDMSKEINALVDGVKTGTIDTVNKKLIQYTGHGLNKKEFLKAKSLTTRLNLLVMDYLQYKSGAAFGAEELKGYQDAGGIMDFNDPDMAKKSLQGMAKYLKDKLARNIEQVPNANERLVLKYQNNEFKDTADNQTTTEQNNQTATEQDTNSKQTFKLPDFKTQEEAVSYLTNLKKNNPEEYEKYKAHYLGGK